MRPIRRSVATILAAVVTLTLAGCGGGSGSSPAAPPTITVLVENADCEVKDISISPFIVEQIDSGGAFSLRIQATALCMGVPLSGVKLTFTIPGATTETAADTDADGNVNLREPTPNNGGADLRGQMVGVAVTGVDGGAYPQGMATVVDAP